LPSPLSVTTRFTTNVPGYGQLYVFRDITMRRQLEEQRVRLEKVITSMKEGFAIVSFDSMRIISTNPAMEQMLGYERNELTGRHFSEIQAGSDEERQVMVETITRVVSRDGFWRFTAGGGQIVYDMSRLKDSYGCADQDLAAGPSGIFLYQPGCNGYPILRGKANGSGVDVLYDTVVLQPSSPLPASNFSCVARDPSGGFYLIIVAATGIGNAAIGEKLFIAAGTVKVHLSHIYAKLGIGNRTQLTAEVIRRDR